jgi:hypothetical protein
MPKSAPKPEPVVSVRLPDGTLIEAVLLDTGKTALAVGSDDITMHSEITIAGRCFVPIPAANNLIRHGVVLLPPPPCPYADKAVLVANITAFIARYVTLSETFLAIATHYILLSWVYDAFQEVPYLRFRGDFGCGKTRALQVVGSLLYKPIFAGGATTVSPLFHTLDLFRGCLVLDEADFRFSDQTAELTKILNNGNAAGFPVLRSVPNDKKLYDPRAFAVFGPKLVAMREFFRDAALESRFLTETMGLLPPERQVPLSLPASFAAEATTLRAQLLTYRFRHVDRVALTDRCYSTHLSARTNQILAPLLACVSDEATRAAITTFAALAEEERRAAGALRPEALVLQALMALASAKEGGVSLGEVRRYIQSHHASEFDRAVTARYLGELVRARLNLPTRKSHGTYKVIATDDRLMHLAERFGLSASFDAGA